MLRPAYEGLLGSNDCMHVPLCACCAAQQLGIEGPALCRLHLFRLAIVLKSAGWPVALPGTASRQLHQRIGLHRACRVNACPCIATHCCSQQIAQLLMDFVHYHKPLVLVVGTCTTCTKLQLVRKQAASCAVPAHMLHHVVCGVQRKTWPAMSCVVFRLQQQQGVFAAVAAVLVAAASCWVHAAPACAASFCLAFARQTACM